jgi:hypothetical protein
MSIRGASIGLALGLVSFGLVGCVHGGPYFGRHGGPAPRTTVGVGVAVHPTRRPPARRVERRPPRPHPNWYWRRGHWAWQTGTYVWISGVWIAPPSPGVVWVDGYWTQRSGTWIWIAGHWR